MLTTTGVIEFSKSELGLEASGVVCRIGPNVESLCVGDRVILAGGSTFSTSITLPEATCVKIPNELSFVEGATMVLAYSTAIHSLMTVGRIEKGKVSYEIQIIYVINYSRYLVCSHT